jgi:hypothetical protein
MLAPIVPGAAFGLAAPLVADVVEGLTGVVVPVVWLDPQPIKLKTTIKPTVSSHTQKRMRIILSTFDQTSDGLSRSGSRMSRTK